MALAFHVARRVYIERGAGCFVSRVLTSMRAGAGAPFNRRPHPVLQQDVVGEDVLPGATMSRWRHFPVPSMRVLPVPQSSAVVAVKFERLSQPLGKLAP